MRRYLPLLCLFISTAALAQGPTGGPLGQLERFEADLRGQTMAIKRDAFIVSQAIAAIGTLDEFQPNTAISKALDRIEAAQVRAGEKPAAGARTHQTLAQMHDELTKARQQGSMVDMTALKRTLMRRAFDLQAVLYRSLQEIRRDREILSDLLSRASRLTTEVDDAMGEALGAALDYSRTGRN